ncbi:hypothetical protein FQV18_0004700, partial [Eudyptula minor novaehollandiae]
LEEFLPTDDPAWDPNDVIQRLLISGYQQLILFGIKNGIPKPKNLSKLYQVVQGDEETPSAFYERLCEVARQWTDSDPERESDNLTFVTLFVGQSNPDIRRKLWKIEGPNGRSIEHLLEVAWRVYNNREDVEKKKQEKEQLKKDTRKARLLAAAIVQENQRKGPRPWGPPFKGRPGPTGLS